MTDRAVKSKQFDEDGDALLELAQRVVDEIEETELYLAQPKFKLKFVWTAQGASGPINFKFGRHRSSADTWEILIEFTEKGERVWKPLKSCPAGLRLSAAEFLDEFVDAYETTVHDLRVRCEALVKKWDSEP